jgi:hypothetical protein
MAGNATKTRTIYKKVNGMRAELATWMGLCSGMLIYMIAAMLFAGSEDPSALFVIVTFAGGWAASAWLLLRGARSTSTVFRRGFLLGAAEWLAAALALTVFNAKPISSVPIVGGGFSIVMAMICFLGFGIEYFMGRETHDKTQ